MSGCGENKVKHVYVVHRGFKIDQCASKRSTYIMTAFKRDGRTDQTIKMLRLCALQNIGHR